jgi:hypothetical protein
MVIFTHWLLFPTEKKSSVPIKQNAGWDPELVRTLRRREKRLALARNLIRIPQASSLQPERLIKKK